jgi:hypothetical protein
MKVNFTLLTSEDGYQIPAGCEPNPRRWKCRGRSRLQIANCNVAFALSTLSTLPAAWQNFDMRQIGSSMVAALISMLEADFVLIALPGHDSRLVTELARSNPKLSPATLKRVRVMLQRQKATLGSGQEFVVADACAGHDLQVVTAPIGFGGDATLAAGSSAARFQLKQRSCCSILEPIRRRLPSSSGWATPREEGLRLCVPKT